MASAATRQRWRRAAWCVGLPVVAVLVLGACSSAKGGSPGSATPPARTTAPPSSSKAAVPAAKIVAAPAATGDLSPAQPIKVSVIGGRLTAVALVNPDGKSVSGSLTPAATSWQNSEALGYSKTYTLTARAVNSAGVASTYNAKYTTVTPSNLTMPYFQYTGGYALQNGATYGVGIVPVIHFDEAISDKRAAMAALSVTTTPHGQGRVVLVRRPDRALPPADLLAVRHQGDDQRQRLRQAGQPWAVRAVRREHLLHHRRQAHRSRRRHARTASRCTSTTSCSA